MLAALRCAAIFNFRTLSMVEVEAWYSRLAGLAQAPTKLFNMQFKASDARSVWWVTWVSVAAVHSTKSDTLGPV